ncbi:MAG TPA: 50S ribosomal protein L11 methyltransferase [Polyangiaceae bacterium]|nr:50S ribosomal protein L11 methyltransferase [Polyangiaceae bacterium]
MRASAPVALHQLRVAVAEEHGDLVAALVIRAGGGGVVEEPFGHDVRLVTYGPRGTLEKLASYLRGLLGTAARVEVRTPPKRLGDWETAWTRRLDAVRVSPSLVLVPEGVRARGGASDVVVRLHPAPTFGFGEHPTTRMAARAVEELARTGRSRSLLDFGAGSGVLALVFVACGGETAIGTDIDARAVRSARKNATLNALSRKVRFSSAPLRSVRGAFDVVVANVERGTILAEAPELAARVAKGGTVLLTGFLGSDVRDVLAAFAPHGLRRRRVEREGDWALLVLGAPARRTPPVASRGARGKRPRVRRRSRTPRSR